MRLAISMACSRVWADASGFGVCTKSKDLQTCSVFHSSGHKYTLHPRGSRPSPAPVMKLPDKLPDDRLTYILTVCGGNMVGVRLWTESRITYLVNVRHGQHGSVT